jgi:hypothetical protein
MNARFFAAAAIAALCACSPQAPPKPEPPAAPAEQGAAPFSINVTFSAKAATKLGGMKEQVIVDAMYYGDPQPGFEPKEAGDVGVDLGSTQVTIAPVNGAAAFTPSFEAAKLAREVSGAPRVLINVYSARMASADNLLSCGIFDDAVSAAAKAAPTIDCKLIEE